MSLRLSPSQAPDRTIIETNGESFQKLCAGLVDDGYRVGLIAASHGPRAARPEPARLVCVLLAGPPGSVIEVHTSASDVGALPSVGDISFPAGRLERRALADLVPGGQRQRRFGPSGSSAVGHSLAYALAVEEALGLVVDDGSAAGRALLLELERASSHLANISSLGRLVGLRATDGLQAARERLLDLNSAVSGHPHLLGAVVPGKARVLSLPAAGTIDSVATQAGEAAAAALAQPALRDHLTGVGVLPPRQAAAVGALGFIARASGVAADARLTHPDLRCYDTLALPLRSEGDAWARLQVRAEELTASLALVQRLAVITDQAQRTPEAVAQRMAPGHGVGIVEGWPGTIVYRVETAADSSVRSVSVADPALFNWPALVIASGRTTTEAVPLVVKSFDVDGESRR